MLGTALLVPSVGYMVYEISDLVDKRVAQFPGNEELSHPRWVDFWYSVPWALLLCALRVAMTRPGSMIHRWGEAVVTHKKDDRPARVRKFTVAVYKLVFFSAVTTYGWFTLRDQSWMPPILGGTGDLDHMWNEYPHSHVSWAVKQYYMVELGYHLADLLYHVLWAERRNGNCFHAIVNCGQ